jgi:arsenite methyltransferase
MDPFLIERPLVAASSAGHTGAAPAYLDTRFLAMQPEYEAMLRGVGIERGWRVLDAGCGGGSHLPLLADLVGRRGRVHALDVAPENIAAVQRLARAGELACALETHLASVLDVPLPEASVDAVWNANVSQYLTDAELGTMLHEFRRVTRPGGVVAVKEIDGALFQVRPIPSTLMWHLFESAQRGGVRQPAGVLRTEALPRFMREAGFTNVTATSTLITRRAPLRQVERQSLHEIVQMLAQFARAARVPADELRQWQSYADAESPYYVLDAPDFCWCETQTVVMGQVPSGRNTSPTYKST